MSGDYAPAGHEHLLSQVAGAAPYDHDHDGDYVTLDEIEAIQGRLTTAEASFAALKTAFVAVTQVNDSALTKLEEAWLTLLTKLEEAWLTLTMGGNGIASAITGLTQRVGELERDNAAMLRRMRHLEEALSLTPPPGEDQAGELEDQADELENQPEPGRWWRVLAADGSLWCETSEEYEARESLRPGDLLQRQYIYIYPARSEWRDEEG